MFAAMAGRDRFLEQDLLNLGWKCTPGTDYCRPQGAYELVVFG